MYIQAAKAPSSDNDLTATGEQLKCTFALASAAMSSTCACNGVRFRQRSA